MVNSSSQESPTAQSPTALAPGALIESKYRVEHELAVGGMGIIYSCTDLFLDRPVAVKVIHPDIAQQEAIRTRFFLEARTLACLNNPHVTRVFECGYTSSGEPYMVMELLDGIDLFELLHDEGVLDPERVARLVLQVCRGLREAHALGVVHRDLKPENLFLSRSRRGREKVKIIDFGISKQPPLRRARSLTNPSMSIGSPHYMAPEQIRTPSEVDGRADLWSLGVVMYELLTGQPPFDGETWEDVYSSVLRATPASLAGVAPPALEAIVSRCLARDRAERFASADDLARALRAYLDEQHAGVSQSSRPSPLPAPVALSVAAEAGTRRPSSRIIRGLTYAAGVATLAAASAALWRPALLASVSAFAGQALAAVAPSPGASPAPAATATAVAVPPPLATSVVGALTLQATSASSLPVVPTTSARATPKVRSAGKSKRPSPPVVPPSVPVVASDEPYGPSVAAEAPTAQRAASDDAQ